MGDNGRKLWVIRKQINRIPVYCGTAMAGNKTTGSIQSVKLKRYIFHSRIEGHFPADICSVYGE
jgi:hypothetical protein